MTRTYMWRLNSTDDDGITKDIAEDRVATEAIPTATTTSSVDPNIQQKMDSIKNVAITIRNISASIRDTVRALRESGAVDELVAAVHEATITMRDTTIEISKISRDLNERGMIKDTAKTLDETVAAQMNQLSYSDKRWKI